MNAPFIPCRRLDPLFRGERAFGEKGEGDLTSRGSVSFLAHINAY